MTAGYRSPVDVPRAAEPLLALPPSRFTAERDALASALARKGDADAAAVRKLRRPVGLAWVLNRLARERPREVASLVAAGERLRAGQRRALSGRGADELRAAEDELRGGARALRAEAERILAAEGKPPAATALARVELLLRVAAAVPGPARDALTRGVLFREPDIVPGELGGFAVLQGGRTAADAPARPLARRRAEPRETSAAAEREARRREKRDRRERQRAAARARRAAELARAAAEREERAAAAATDRARRARERADRARAAATRLADEARRLEADP
jgi:hypothetical protein